MKLNCDARWDKNRGISSLGSIGRDDQGIFKGARFKACRTASSSLVAKATAVRDGVALAKENNWNDVEIESDSKIREGNNVAHVLAYWDCGLEREATWLNVPLHWLLSTLATDCNN
ncbi:hypothetical protein LIER_12185 [Lithospermum erythrorhizon]|uniref:RNase H type-1 domain-containing protein n=1 Tax=Lithospermum erythrorhizon TaxID=34254 RepID=A0AAV3PRD3_LITER